VVSLTVPYSRILGFLDRNKFVVYMQYMIALAALWVAELQALQD
jgi:hypothetical protein